MSGWLSSVLSSIGEEGKIPSVPPPQRRPAAGAQCPTSTAPKPPTTASNSGIKRKVDSGENSNAAKLPRINAATLPGRVGDDILDSTRPYSSTSLTASNSSINPGVQGSAKAATASDGLAMSTAPAKPAPKKGSYADIIARAKAVKEVQSDIGQIKHKAVPKLTKKERLAQEAEAAQRSKSGENKAINPPSSSQGKIVQAQGQEGVQGEKKKPSEVGYKGTMRAKPEQTAYRGTMNGGRLTGASARRACDGAKRDQLERQHSAGRHQYEYSDEEEDEEDEDEDSDSMEGGGFDELEREEEMSLRAARKEDDAAKREEDEHRRQKAVRKKKLEEMASAAAAKRR